MTFAYPLVLAALAGAALLSSTHALALDPGSQLVGCDRAGELIRLDASSHLDPSCTYTRGIEIVASDVVLDCQGAHIATTDRRYGVRIVAPTDVALSNVTVRNCHIEGFLNNVHVEREGFRELPAGGEYEPEHLFSNILIEDSTLSNSRGVGAYVNGYVTGVTLRNLHVEGAGSTGIYLETGSKDNVVEGNRIVNNGFRENGPGGQPFEIAGVAFWFWGTGREGLAIDGSRYNRVVGNHFEGNSAGGIFLYKNCGEFPERDRYFERRYGSDANVIEGNTFVGGETGVWIGSRMGENTIPMECTDPAYYSDGVNRIVLDYAPDNVVRGNVFDGVTWGVRVEDDRALVADNRFLGDDPGHQAVLVGTPWRTSVLGLPVEDATITGNRSFIAGNGNPYRWVHGHEGTTFADNQSLGRPVGFCEGVPPRRNLFIFTLAFEVLLDPDDPPTGGPPVFPGPAPLPPCPASCATGPDIAKPRIMLRRLATPPGDDTLFFTGEMELAHPFSPALDPLATGVQIVLADASGVRSLDVLVPGGAWDPVQRSGWTATPNGRSWRYRNRTASPPGGITSIVLEDLSRKLPGLVRFTVRGARGSYAVDRASLPLEGLLILDPPTAETGQCGQATFPAPSCRDRAASVVCR